MNGDIKYYMIMHELLGKMQKELNQNYNLLVKYVKKADMALDVLVEEKKVTEDDLKPVAEPRKHLRRVNEHLVTINKVMDEMAELTGEKIFDFNTEMDDMANVQVELEDKTHKLLKED
jgi:hypothetical protein